MLNPPERFSEELLRALLADQWKLQVTALEYVPVGFGSHHWSARTADGGRWFVNADSLDASGGRLAELRNALGAARTLVDGGYSFAVAPEHLGSDELVVPLDAYLAVSVYRELDGESFTWGEWERYPADHRDAVLKILAELHAIPSGERGPADVEDFAIPERAGLEHLLADGGPVTETGPFTERAVEAVLGRADSLSRALARYDRLTEIGRAGRDRYVLTHGEPHPANTMKVDGRYVLIDWESALIAPPERDLWNFGSGDPEMCELYSLRWDLAEVAGYLGLFLRGHRDGPNETASWRYLTDTLAKLETTTARI